MNRIRIWLTLAASAGCTLTAAAAPAPPPPSDGPISDAIALRDFLPNSAPPSAASAVKVEEGVLELQTVVMVPVSRTVMETVTLPDGKKEQVVRVVTTVEFAPQAMRWKADAIKFFLVSKGAKLEAIDATKATAMLKQRTPVLTGDSADVDPRNLEVFRPGTLYLVLPPPQQLPPLPPLNDKP